jgi:hypothetical protein
MTRFFDEFEAEREKVCAPLRSEAGWDGDPEGLTADIMWEYITHLENALTAQVRLPRLLGLMAP